MRVAFHKNFGRSYKKAPQKIKEQFKERLRLFLENPPNPLLNDHALHGKWREFRSINITGDWRAIYKYIREDLIEFALMDTHSNLYG